MFTWGAILFFQHLRPARRRARGLRGRQAVDVALAAFRGASRDQRAARPPGPAGQADDDLAGRDPQLLRPGVPGEAGRAAGPLHARSGSSRRKVGRYHLFCAEYCGTNHSTMGGWVSVMEPVEFQHWLSQGGAGPSMAERGRAALRAAPLRRLPPGQPDRQRPEAGGSLRPAGPDPAGQGSPVRHWPTTATSATRSCVPKSQVVAGYEPVMPSFEDQISEPDLLKIIAYIKSIGAKEATR